MILCFILLQGWLMIVIMLLTSIMIFSSWCPDVIYSYQWCDCTNRLIENMVDIDLKLSSKIRIPRKGNENRNFKLDHVCAVSLLCIP
jgi:hypothetical protein